MYKSSYLFKKFAPTRNRTRASGSRARCSINWATSTYWNLVKLGTGKFFFIANMTFHNGRFWDFRSGNCMGVKPVKCVVLPSKSSFIRNQKTSFKEFQRKWNFTENFPNFTVFQFPWHFCSKLTSQGTSKILV